jgi:hypothetical protein
MNLAALRQQNIDTGVTESPGKKQEKLAACVISVLRLKMLFVAAKIVTHSEQAKIRYSMHDARAENIIDFMQYLDRKRAEQKEWDETVALRYYRSTG